MNQCEYNHLIWTTLHAEAATGSFLKKKVFLKLSKVSQKTLVLESLFNKFCKNFVKKRLQHRCFPVKFAKLLRMPTLKNISQRLLLYMRQAAVQCWFQTLFSVFFYNDKKDTNVLRLSSRSNILFEEFFNKLRKKTRFYPCRSPRTTLNGIVTYLMLIQHVLFSLE